MKLLFKALMEVQKEAVSVTKDSKGYNYTYASLPHVCETLYPVLHKHGLVISQILKGKELETILCHPESGEELRSLCALEYTGNDSQKMGSAITYSRRYSLLAIVGVPVEDDDGASTANRNSPKQDNPKTKPFSNIIAPKEIPQNIPNQKVAAAVSSAVNTVKNQDMPMNATMYQNLVASAKDIEAGWQKVIAYSKSNFGKDPKVLFIREYEQVMKILKSGAL